MNNMEKYIERKIRRASYKISNIKNSNLVKNLINKPFNNLELKNRMKKQDEMRKKFMEEEKVSIECELSEEAVEKIEVLQRIFKIEFDEDIAFNDMLNFILNAMNYGKFEIWLLDCKFNEIEVSLNDKILKFLKETDISEIFTLYHIQQNYNKPKEDVKTDEKEKVRKNNF